MIKWLAALFLVFGLAVYSPVSVADQFPDQGSALDACKAAARDAYPTRPASTTDTYCGVAYPIYSSDAVPGSATWPTQDASNWVTVPGRRAYGFAIVSRYVYFWWPVEMSFNGCQAGSIVPDGTKYTQSSLTGEACTSGTTSCEMSFVLGGPNSGKQMLTGVACPATSDTPKEIPKSSETTNADGGKTYCDGISGKCVTVSPGATDAPASSSSSANHSTDTTSTTDTPASSSSSTTTSETTTTGDGSGSGTGSGNSTSVGTSHTKTDVPASSSSTASKCTTGACDVGNADGNIGQMYTAGTDTPASVYAQFKADVASSPVIGAATGFFNVSGLSGGSCPTWQIPGNKYWGQSGFSFDFFCSSGMLALLALAGWMVLAAGAFCAFRIALY